MADAATVQVIRPPDRLRARLGARFVGVDPEAAARAEAAVRQLSAHFDGWLAEESGRLEAARDRFFADGGSDARQELYRCAHDLKGLAGTCGFPLVTRVCASLCRMLERDACLARATGAVDAHVDAVGALLREGPGAPTTTCEALEALTATLAGEGDAHG